MAKEFFRFLRGELNGFYITSLNNALIKLVESNKKDLIKFNNQQLETGKMDSATLYNLGRFACVKLPRRPTSEAKTSIYMTDSHVVDGVEFSERGLYRLANEDFYFVHTSEDITSPDINTLASSAQRSSLVGDEEVIGYIPEDATNVIDDDGNVRPEKVLSEPPTGKAYSDFRGNQFLFLAEGGITYESIAFSLYIELFKALQWIRYNGVSLSSLVRIIKILCPNGLVKIQTLQVADNNRLVNVLYQYDSSVVISNKEQRLTLLQYIVSLKFKQTRLVEV